MNLKKFLEIEKGFENLKMFDLELNPKQVDELNEEDTIYLLSGILRTGSDYVIDGIDIPAIKEVIKETIRHWENKKDDIKYAIIRSPHYRKGR